MAVKLSLTHTLREEQKSRVSESMVLRRICDPRREEVAGEECIMRSFIICTLYQLLG
jgi:hypothetical protein